jgi:hypothetical protein
VNTYKPLSLPLPAGAKPTQTWRLGLFSPPARTVQGSLETLAQHVCGVWSEGVTVTAPQQKKDRYASVKQTRVFREWRLPGHGERQDAPGVLRIVEQTSFDLDKVRPPSSRPSFLATLTATSRTRKYGTRASPYPPGSTHACPIPPR